ncbi:hypothetical protein, partial [Acinetobacter nosocomialis]
TLSNVTTTGSAKIGNGLTVEAGTTALRNTTVGGTLGVTGATTLNNTLNVVGNTTLSNVTTTGSAKIGNGLTVEAGTTALRNTTVGGTLGVTGATTLSNVTTTGSATIGS